MHFVTCFFPVREVSTPGIYCGDIALSALAGVFRATVIVHQARRNFIAVSNLTVNCFEMHSQKFCPLTPFQRNSIPISKQRMFVCIIIVCRFRMSLRGLATVKYTWYGTNRGCTTRACAGYTFQIIRLPYLCFR